MSVKYYRGATKNSWLEVCPASSILKYLNLLNMDSVEGNVALALQNPSLPLLGVPANLAVTPAGSSGGVGYQYAVTALNANGQSEPCDAVSITTGVVFSQLNDTNFHSVSWDAVSGATGYRVYCLVNGNIYWKDVTETSAVHKGDWAVGKNWPWMNTSQILVFFAAEALSGHGIIQRYSDEETPSGHKVVLATDIDQLNVFARYVSV